MLNKDWKSSKIDIRNSELEGKGMFANTDIKKGEKIIIWGGNYTDKKGSEEQLKNGKLIMQWDDDLYSYEDRGDDEGYFVNHSCEPNVWMQGAYTLIAKNNINAGEEITCDYAIWEADENFISKWRCNCGSKLCRSKVKGKDWRNKELQERYKDHFSPLLNKRILKLEK